MNFMAVELSTEQIRSFLFGISIPPQPQIMVDLQMEQLADRSGRLHFWHQNSSLVPGEKVLLNSRIDLSRVRASGI